MAEKNLFLTNRNLRDLNPLVAGEEHCAPGHSFGPAIRKYTLIHYVVSGRGTLYARDGAYPVEAGQAFLIRPGEVTTYTADLDQPWHYRWIGFDGELAKQFDCRAPVFSVESDIFRRIIQAEGEPATEYRLAGELFRLYVSLFSQTSAKNPHVRQVENYIRSSYMLPIRVEQIARQINLDRRYLSRLFKQETGYSLQEYLLKVRLEEAEQHIRQGSGVQQAAQLVGYSDVSNFAKMFKKKFGKNPSEMKK